MTEKQLMQAFVEFNSVYFDGKLTCELTITEDWIDDNGNYHPDSAVSGDDLFEASCDGVKVRLASALYMYPPKNLISIPKWKISGEKATQGVLLHEMAHAAASEPEIGDGHGPKWYAEMHRLWKKGAPINLHDVTPGYSQYPLVEQYGIGSEFWKKLG